MTADSPPAQNLPPVVRLSFKTDDLIVKQGDYGISIYRIIEGKVAVCVESEQGEVQVAALDPGEIIGEMIVLSGNRTRRSASVRALEPTTLEAWHPSTIMKEYERMPYAIRYLANQVTQQLARYNKMLTELHELKKRKTAAAPKPRRDLRPRGYRKDIDIDCMYKPVEDPDSPHLWGRIKNISKGGMRMDIRRVNTFDRSHAVGDKFIGSTFLPTGKRLDIQVVIANVQTLPDNKTITLGLRFLDFPGASESALGFFLLG